MCKTIIKVKIGKTTFRLLQVPAVESPEYQVVMDQKENGRRLLSYSGDRQKQENRLISEIRVELDKKRQGILPA